MKHKVTVEVESKKHFLGIPYMVTEQKKVMVDGKTYRQMKQEERDRELARQDEAVAAMIVLEEEEELCDL